MQITLNRFRSRIRSESLRVPFPGGPADFQAAAKSLAVLPGWSYTDRDTQDGLEFSPTYPGAYPNATPTPGQPPVKTPTPRPPGIAQVQIPHTVEGRAACTTCHTVGGAGVGAPGGTGMPASHQGRTDAVCTGCHQAAAPAATVTVTLTPTPTPHPSVPPAIYGWVKNAAQEAVSGVSAVIIIRGNEKAYNLVLDAVKVPVTGVIQPGSWQVFGASFGRDYGDLYGGYEVMVQGSSQMPGILEAP